MEDDFPHSGGEDNFQEATEIGCEAIYVPEEEGQPGHWHFTQKYDEGIIWKRIKWSWIALDTKVVGDQNTDGNFSRNLKRAEIYLRDQFPEAQIPFSLLKETLKESGLVSQRPIDPCQGELLGVGITKYHRLRGRKRLFLAFPSGDMRIQISIAFIGFENKPKASDVDIPTPVLTAVSTHETPFRRQIQQIVFPRPITSEEPNDTFAVRTVHDVVIFTCSKEKGKVAPTLERSPSLPLLFSKPTAAGYIADVAFDPTGDRIAVITIKGHWIVYELRGPERSTTVVSVGTPETSLLQNEEREGWWKLLWTNDINKIIVTRRKAVYLLDTESGDIMIVLRADPKEQIRGLSMLEGLGGIAIAVLTSSEIWIVDMTDWRILLKQKHRRDADDSLMVNAFSFEDVTTICIYSRLNALITCHQLSEEVPLSWLDTPFQLDVPRHHPNLPSAVPNLGLVTIPSQIMSEIEDLPESDETSFTTFKLQTDLSIIGDMYGNQGAELRMHSNQTTMKKMKKRISPEKVEEDDSQTEDESRVGDEDKWIPNQSNWILDFSDIAKAVIPTFQPSPSLTRHQIRELKEKTIDNIEQNDFCLKTLFAIKDPDVEKLDPEMASSNAEQIIHSLQEKGYEIRHVHPGAHENGDPEDDSGSISTIYRDLMATLPKQGLDATVALSKENAIRNIAVDVGLANIAVVKQSPSSDPSSLDLLRKYINLDSSIQLSEAAKFVLSKWSEVPQPIQLRPITPPKRKRVRVNESQRVNILSQPEIISSQPVMSSQPDPMTQITMSQPVAGRHGTRTLRKKPRKSGF